jgi:hypothetical protein
MFSSRCVHRVGLYSVFVVGMTREIFPKRFHRFLLLFCCCFVMFAIPSLSQEPAAPSAPPDAPKPAPSGGIFARLAHFYHEDWFPAPVSGAPAPAAPRRGLASPLDSLPFPNADWSYGGSPVIGEPDGNTYPLMTALYPKGNLPRIKFYGWLAPAVDGSTSSDTNAPEANDVYANRFELNQAVLYIERLPDTVQQDHFDWGFHLTALYGTDYRFTTAKGYFSHQWVDLHRQYGFDPSLEYLDLYFPRLGHGGSDLRIGRFISVPGVEAQLAPNNYIFSHTLLYSIDPFTDTGVMLTTKLNDQWLIQLGLTDGHDVALWTPDAKPTLTACLDYTTHSVNDNWYVCANGINDGKYAYNNLQQYDATWYHRFNKKFHLASEAWYMYEREVPAIHPAKAAAIKPEQGANPAFCLANELRCTAPEYAADSSLQMEISQHSYLAFRGDFVDDKKGQRTGYPTRYSEGTLSWNRWFGATVQLRPEVRFDRAWDVRAYDGGRRYSQFTAASDVIFHF